MSELGSPLVVVVTGASAGVGRATARELARRGARIGLVSRGRERLAAAPRDVEELGGRALAALGALAGLRLRTRRSRRA